MNGIGAVLWQIHIGSELFDLRDPVESPAGGVVNQIWDVAMMPGRLGIRVATTVLKRGQSEN